MQYQQDLSLAKRQTEKMYMQNPNRSISATFRFLRKKPYISFIGDYPILSAIIEIIFILGIIPSRYQVIYALNQSEELNDRSKKDKNILLDELFKSAYVQTKPLKNFPYKAKTKKMTKASS